MGAPPEPAPALPLTEVEAWLIERLRPERLPSSRALYDLMPRQRGGQLPFVDVPYDPLVEAHWADAARVADYAAHVPPGPARVLDVGPGDGWPSLPLAAARQDALVVGLDPSPRRTAVCRENARRLGVENARFVVGTAEAMPFAGGAFDAVTASASLEESERPLDVFGELARVLRPGGVLRASYQDWVLPAPELESVLLWDGERAAEGRLLLCTYSRRVRTPPLERRYTLELPPEGEAQRLHEAALVTASGGRRVYGETLLSADLGVPLLERFAPHVRRTTVVELRRWTTDWLADALRGAGFREARTTVHPGDLARHVARRLIASGEAGTLAPHFDALTRALGVAAATQPGPAMVTAIR